MLTLDLLEQQELEFSIRLWSKILLWGLWKPLDLLGLSGMFHIHAINKCFYEFFTLLGNTESINPNKYDDAELVHKVQTIERTTHRIIK